MAGQFRVELRTPGGTHEIVVGGDQYILDGAREAGIDLPSTCLQGWCLTCAARVVRGSVDQSDSLRFYPEDAKAGFALLCTGKPREPLVLETHQKRSLQQFRIERGLPSPRG